MGLGLYFAEGEGPKFERPLRDECGDPRPGGARSRRRIALRDRRGREIRRALGGRVPLIGFAGSPYTLACYMVEGGAQRRFPHRSRPCSTRGPDLLHRILEVNAQAVTRLPQRADRGRRAGGDDLRYLGREPVARSLPRVLARLPAAHHRAAQARSTTACAFRRSCSPRAAASGWKTSPRCGCDAVGLDWTVDLGAGARRASATVSRCRATSIRSCCSRRRGHRSAKRERSSRPSATAAATCSTSATAFRNSPRRNTSRRWSIACTRARAIT